MDHREADLMRFLEEQMGFPRTWPGPVPPQPWSKRHWRCKIGLHQPNQKCQPRGFDHHLCPCGLIK